MSTVASTLNGTAQLSWLERSALAIGIWEIPLQLDKYLFFRVDDSEMGAVAGLNISLTTGVLLLLYGPHTGLLFRQQREDTAGKLRAFFETGLWYQKVTLYGVLFLINYAGTVLSGVTAIGVCLLVWLLEPLLRDPHSKPPEPVVLSAVSAILLVASFVNLLIILP